MDNSEKTYKILKKITEKMLKLVEKTDKDFNKILSIISKNEGLGSEFRDAFKEEFLVTLSERLVGKPLIAVI